MIFCRKTLLQLYAGDVLCARTLLAVDDLEADLVANLELIERNAGKIVRVEEEVLRFVLTSDESESFLGESLDCSLHVLVKL